MTFLSSFLKDREKTVRRLVILVLLYCIPAFQAMLPIDDPDIWWRLRIGQWIVENQSVPFVDFLSVYGSGKLWIEYSWLFDVLVYAVHAHFGLAGLVYFVVAMALIIAFVTHQLVRRAGLPFPAEIALVALALGGMKPLMTPRPWLLTIIFFSIELLIIARAGHLEKERLLWALPLLFAIWANFHVQFIYGLAVLGLFFAEALLTTCVGWFEYRVAAPPISAKRLALVTLACIAATMLTPYHYLLYKQIFEYIGETGIFQNISELHPMFFRSADSWLVLILTIAAAFVLGRQRKWLPYPTLLFLMGAFLAFRARRDAWFLLLVGIWIISECVRSSTYGSSFQLSKRQIAIGGVAIAVALYFASVGRQISEEHLQAVVETRFPVKAVNYVRANQFPGPLFNDYDWGGFLIWSLPELPVALDGRLNLYTNEGLERSIHTWEGRPEWESDPHLVNARLVISDKRRPLSSLLRIHPGYKTVYEDNTAVVFVPVH